MAKAVYGPIESINTGDMTVDEWQKQLVETWEKLRRRIREIKE